MMQIEVLLGLLARLKYIKPTQGKASPGSEGSAVAASSLGKEWLGCIMEGAELK